MMQLYSYFRSSAAYRVRITLNYKNILYDTFAVHLLKEGGEQFKHEYEEINPQQLVPALKDGEQVLTQSLAIIQYIDERYPEPPLMPGDYRDRAKVGAIALAIACDIHPLNNLRVLQYLEKEMQLNSDQKQRWIHHWMVVGLSALEKMIAPNSGGKFCYGDQVSLADICLIPQLYNAHRFNVSLEDFPVLKTIEAHCLSQAYFYDARPENQPDVEL